MIYFTLNLISNIFSLISIKLTLYYFCLHLDNSLLQRNYLRAGNITWIYFFLYKKSSFIIFSGLLLKAVKMTSNKLKKVTKNTEKYLNGFQSNDKSFQTLIAIKTSTSKDKRDTLPTIRNQGNLI